MRDKKLLIATVLIIAVIVFGEAYVYAFDRDATYSFSSERLDGGYEITVGSGISNEFQTLVLGNGGFEPASEYIVYYDEQYGEALDDAWHATGGRELSQSYYVDQLILELDNMGVAARTVNAQELGDLMRDALEDGMCDQAVVVLSGALPDTVYTGQTSDPILSWLSLGGRLYWAGNLLGAYYSVPGDVVEVKGDYQTMFLGAECLNAEGITKGYDVIDNGYVDALSLAGNGTLYGADPSLLEGALAIGYTDGTHASVVLTPRGEGMVCILGGTYSDDQRSDLVQVLASGLCPESVILHSEQGSVTRDTVTVRTGELDYDGNVCVYAYLGGYYPVFGGRDDY